MSDKLKPGKLLKQHMINQIAENLKNSNNLFVSECGLLTNKEIEDLKERLTKASGNYMIVKNSMCLKALQKVKLDAVSELIKGTCGITYGDKDPVMVSKVLVDFAKENEKFLLKGACLDGEVVTTGAVKELASIPSREVLLTRLVSSLQSPISGVVGVFAGVIRKLMYAINAVKEKSEKEGGQNV